MGRSALVGAAVAVERGCSDTEGANVQVVVSSAGERGPRVSGCEGSVAGFRRDRRVADPSGTSTNPGTSTRRRRNELIRFGSGKS